MLHSSLSLLNKQHHLRVTRMPHLLYTLQQSSGVCIRPYLQGSRCGPSRLITHAFKTAGLAECRLMPRRLLHLPQSRHTPRLWCPALPHLCGHRAAALSRHAPVQCDTQYTHAQCWFNVIPLKTGGPAMPRTARAWYPYIRLVFLFFMWDQVSLLEI